MVARDLNPGLDKACFVVGQGFGRQDRAQEYIPSTIAVVLCPRYFFVVGP